MTKIDTVLKGVLKKRPKGQNIIPKRYHPIADTLDEDTLEKRMNELHRATQSCVDVMPMHEKYVEEVMKA